MPYKNPEDQCEYKKKWFQGHKNQLREHRTQYMVEWRHKTGQNRPMQEARDCSSYLGVYIAERALSKFFDHIERMPYGNPGFDFLCGKGKRIDIKSACLHQGKCGSPFWIFKPNHNMDADYFLCLAFNNRESLEPMHIWFLPGNVVNDHVSFTITNTFRSLTKWVQYEMPLDKVITCCIQLKEVIEYEKA